MNSGSSPGLWRHARLFGDDGAVARRAVSAGWTLGEADTPLQESPELATRLGVGRLLLKREDLNPSGSHKDRGVLYQVAAHRREAASVHVLSSSGNAAVAAAAACGAVGDRLVAFVAPGTAHSKRARLLASDAVVIETVKPINFARYAARVFGLQDLRGSRDPIASIGYRSLAAELHEAEPELDAVVTFSSSGISMEGIADGYELLGAAPSLWSVQSGECVGIVRALDPDAEGDPRSPAGRLGIRNPPHAPALAARLRSSGGGAVVVRTEPIQEWQVRLREVGVVVSAEGAAVLAGIAAMPGLSGRAVAAVMTGRATDGPAVPDEEGPAPVSLGSYLEVRAFFTDVLGLEPL